MYKPNNLLLNICLSSLVLTLLASGSSSAGNSKSSWLKSSHDTIAQANPCAGKNPCAGANPCAGKNPSDKKRNTAASVFSDEAGLAIRGSDPVAYFTQAKPVKGSDKFEYQWMGATWRFSSAENKSLFEKNPQAYAPQYGGYCAKALSEGNLAPIDPNAWKIVDGKLYLNYSLEVQQQWFQDIPGNIAKANANWAQILSNDVGNQ